jgi:hypothetical protein
VPRLPPITLPSVSMNAQWRTEPPIARLSSLAGVIERFAILRLVTAPLRSWRVPTLPAGRLNAAYEARPATASSRQARSRRGRSGGGTRRVVSLDPFGHPFGLCPGPSVPLAPNAGGLLVLELAAVLVGVLLVCAGAVVDAWVTAAV